jgi:hypothetical protein
MATRKTITKAQAVRYRNASRAVKSEILDVVCAVAGHHRDYARRALRLALTPRVVKALAGRSPKYDSEVVAALEKCWAVANAPAGKRLAPLLSELVPALRRHGELGIDEDAAALLVSMSAETIDRRLATPTGSPFSGFHGCCSQVVWPRQRPVASRGAVVADIRASGGVNGRLPTDRPNRQVARATNAILSANFIHPTVPGSNQGVQPWGERARSDQQADPVGFPGCAYSERRSGEKALPPR